jgi:hypothetical protein
MAKVSDLEFVDTEPPLAKKSAPTNAYWREVRAVLEMCPDKWAKVITFDKTSSAASRAGNINANRNDIFPADLFEARYTKDETSSTLYLIYRPKGGE